jgi:hypothetical protein
MKKIGVGVLIGILVTLGGQHVLKLYEYHKFKDDFVLFDLAEFDIQQKLPDSRVLDVSICLSKAEVNYAYEKLYDVHVTYERDGKIKEITTRYVNLKMLGLVLQLLK